MKFLIIMYIVLIPIYTPKVNAACGDKIIEINEQCDDGNLLNGDVNQDKKIDMNDYYSLSYALSGKFKINELCKCNADVNEDKLINQNDINTLYNSIRYNKPLVKEGECEKPTLSSIVSPTPSPSPSPSPIESPY